MNEELRLNREKQCHVLTRYVYECVFLILIADQKT